MHKVTLSNSGNVLISEISYIFAVFSQETKLPNSIFLPRILQCIVLTNNEKAS